MTREIWILPRKPKLLKRCRDVIVKYIRENYGGETLTVDAIVAPETKGFIFASIVAVQLLLPFIPICKAKELLAHPGDLKTATYISRKNQVSLTCEIPRSVVFSNNS